MFRVGRNHLLLQGENPPMDSLRDINSSKSTARRKLKRNWDSLRIHALSTQSQNTMHRFVYSFSSFDAWHWLKGAPPRTTRFFFQIVIKNTPIRSRKNVHVNLFLCSTFFYHILQSTTQYSNCIFVKSTNSVSRFRTMNFLVYWMM